MSHQNLDATITLIQSTAQINRKLDNYLGAINGVGLSEFFALHYLKGSDFALSRIVLAEHLALTASGVTRLLAPMQKTGLVAKQVNERDARLSLVALTEAGRTKYQEALLTVEQALEKVFMDVSETDKKRLVGILTKLR